MLTDPSTDRPDDDGRDSRGRFAPGNTASRGNPHARRVAKLRSILLEAVTDDDFRAVARKLIELARSGDLKAIKELLDRTLGRPTEADLLERISQLEQTLQDSLKSSDVA